MDLVPVVDIQNPEKTSLEALSNACANHGFFQISGHGHDKLIDRMWDETRRFFAEPSEVKNSVRRTQDMPLGYYDRELTKRKRDCKEVFDIMAPGGRGRTDRNRWPENLPGFRETQAEFFDAFSELAEETLRVIHRSLDLPDEIIATHKGNSAVSTVRLNHYTVEDPVAGDSSELAELADVSLGDHTDPGVLTLLLQDNTGGLQALGRDGNWIDVPPSPGLVVVNIGDILQVWTNDRYRASVHRVTRMTRSSRLSIPYFYNPQVDASGTFTIPKHLLDVGLDLTVFDASLGKQGRLTRRIAP